MRTENMVKDIHFEKDITYYMYTSYIKNKVIDIYTRFTIKYMYIITYDKQK